MKTLLAAEVTAATALGAVFSLPFVHTGWWGLHFLLIGAVAWRVAAVGTARAALIGLFFGAGWLGAATWWLFISLHRYGGLPAPLATLAVAGLALALSAYLAAAFALFARLRRGAAWGDGVLFAALWLATELARGVIFTGFPWVATGYAQVDAPLAGLAPWIGVYGIGFVTVLCAAQVAFSLREGVRRAVRPALLSIAVVAASPWAARDFTTSAGQLGVSLLQTNVPQDEKFAPQHLPDALVWLDGALRSARGPLVVAPETAIALLPDQLGPDAWQRLTESFRAERAALIGLPLGSYDAGYTNSAAGVSAASATSPGGFYRYDKQHLVPFGEFIPPGFRWFVDMMNIPLGDFARGPRVPAAFAFADQRIGPNICYEDLFGEELALRMADTAQAPTMFANLSNIGWFGDTIALEQHLHISRMRTLEFQRPMLRATNTGTTAVIDHRGRVSAALAPFTRGTLDAKVDGRVGLTPFARWASRAGLWPPVLLVLGVVFWAGWARRRSSAA